MKAIPPIKVMKAALFGFFVLIVLAFISKSVFSEDRYVVSLIYFRATGLENEVQLEWATGSELNTAGFRLERSLNANGPYQALDKIGFVPAVGDPIGGVEYSRIDDDGVVNGQTYWYRLIEVEFDGSENIINPISVIAGSGNETSTATSTAIPTATSGNGSGRTVTATPTPSATPALTGTSTQSGSSLVGPTRIITTRGSVLTPTPLRIEDQEEPAQNSGNQEAPSTPSSSVSEPYPSQQGDSTGRDFEDITTAGEGQPGLAPTVINADRLPPYPPGSQETEILAGEVAGQSRLIDSDGPSVIGDNELRSTDSQEKISSMGGTSLLFLWFAFIAALIIFIAGVYASILFFSKRRIRGH